MGYPCEFTTSVDRDAGRLHEMPDQFATVESVCGQGRRVSQAAEIPDAVDEAFRLMLGGRPRPYAIEVPLDLLKQDVSLDGHEPVDPRAPSPAASSVEEAADLIASDSYQTALVIGA